MQYRMLGPIEVSADGVAVGIGGPQQRRLLGLLVTQRGRVVPTQRMVDVLWPEGEAPEGAARSVLTYVSRLRSALGDGSIVNQASGYRLDMNDATCDIDEFEDGWPKRNDAYPTRPSNGTTPRSGCGGATRRSVSSAPSGGRWPMQPGSPKCASARVSSEPRRASHWVITTGRCPTSKVLRSSIRCASGRSTC